MARTDSQVHKGAALGQGRGCRCVHLNLASMSRDTGVEACGLCQPCGGHPLLVRKSSVGNPSLCCMSARYGVRRVRRGRARPFPSCRGSRSAAETVSLYLIKLRFYLKLSSGSSKIVASSRNRFFLSNKHVCVAPSHRLQLHGARTASTGQVAMANVREAAMAASKS